MKKIVAIILLAICMFHMCGCDNKGSWEYFDAKVIQIGEDNNVLVEVTEKGTSGITLGSEAFVQTTFESDYMCPQMKKDDKIRVYFNGEVLEPGILSFECIYDIDLYDRDGNIVNE